MIRDLIAAPDNVDAIVRRHTGATGLGALALFTTGGGVGAWNSSTSDPVVDDVVGILRLCQTADDEAVVLKDVCARIGHQLHAAAVACFTASDGWQPIASDGPRFEPTIGERAVSAGITIGPHVCDGRVEAAAPVPVPGGAPIAAICARWTLGSPYERSRASTVLTMAAAAVAPVVASAIARRSRPMGPGAVELLGVTPAMLELRQAADAPRRRRSRC